MLNKVIETNVLAPHVLRVTFADGYSGVHDFVWIECECGNLAEPLADSAYFAQVFLEHGAFTLPNGYDMCPDWLRMKMACNGATMGSHAAA